MTGALVPLAVAVPLIVAALLVGTGRLLPRAANDAAAIATSLATTVLSLLLTRDASGGTIVYWFGGWVPRHDIAIGIAFAIDPLAAGFAALIACLFTASLVYAWHYFDSVGTLFHTLMLVFLAAMVGFCFSGDLFTLFVFFELMSVVAFALTGYKIEASSIEGALNFAITNTIGAFITLWGIALLYGRIGALNFAQLSRALAAMPPSPLIMGAFLLISCGFLVKAAVVPFHFWLGDAHAVAPTPVCVLFSGVMVELGLFGVFRLYWDVFEPALHAAEPKLRLVFLCIGCVTALVGAVMCFWQRHIKRLLAFSTISHVGMILAGCGTFTARGLAGAGMYVLGHAMIKGALFMCAGLFLQRFGSLDEIALQGRGRKWKWLGAIACVAGLGLAGFPPYGTYEGKAMMEQAAARFGQYWIVLLFTFSSAVTGAAVLRVTARIFLGWGCEHGGEEGAPTEDEHKETRKKTGNFPPAMVLTAAALAVLPALSGLLPPLTHGILAAAGRFTQTSAYTAAVLDGVPTRAIQTSESGAVTPEGVAAGCIAALAAACIAAASLSADRFSSALRKVLAACLDPAMNALRFLHSGDVRDYVAWLAFGAALFAGAFAWAAWH